MNLLPKTTKSMPTARRARLCQRDTDKCLADLVGVRSAPTIFSKPSIGCIAEITFFSSIGLPKLRKCEAYTPSKWRAPMSSSAAEVVPHFLGYDPRLGSA